MSFLIATIDLGIPIDPIISDCKAIVEKFKATTTEDISAPYSIVLTKNPDFEETAGELVGYKKIHNTQYFDRQNEAQLLPDYAATSLTSLVKVLPFPFSIIRLSVLPPNTIISMHTDASCHAQLAITTNEDCFVGARTAEIKHVPVDGHLYIISTTTPHTAFNASQDERIHLSISIFDKDYIKLLRNN